MSKVNRLVFVIVLACAVAAVLVVKSRTREVDEAAAVTGENTSAIVRDQQASVAVEDIPAATALPRLVDLGAGKCTSCKMMTPILEELKKDFAGKFEVEFVDVWKDPEAGEKYGIRMIPTQIFFDSTGKELFRHEGFFGRDEILAKWREHGVTSVAQGGQ